MLYTVLKNICKVFYHIAFRITIEGEENIPSSGGAVICPNHISNHDAVLLTAVIRRRLTYLGKEEVFKFKPFGYILKKVGAIPVKRGTGDIGAVRKAIEVLKDSKLMIIFPEGTRNKTDAPLLEFRSGASLIAYKAQCPIVPCAIIGKFKPFSKIKIVFAEPISTLGKTKDDVHSLTEEIKNEVGNMLEEVKQ